MAILDMNQWKSIRHSDMSDRRAGGNLVQLIDTTEYLDTRFRLKAYRNDNC